MRRFIGLFLFLLVSSVTVFAQEQFSIKEKRIIVEANSAFSNAYFEEALQ